MGQMPMKCNVFSTACKLQIEHILVVLDKKDLALILSIPHLALIIRLDGQDL